MTKHIGLLGGTFNPIHFGHLRIAEELAESLNFDAVKFIPSANPPHKSLPKVSASDRAKMVALAIKDNPRFSLDTIELDREGASYTIDTLISLRESMGTDTQLYLIMGTDAFVKFDTWHRWQAILQYCHIILVQRTLTPNPTASQEDQPQLSQALEHFLKDHYTENTEDLATQVNGLIHMQSVTPLRISSTDIRQHVQQLRSIRYLCPQNVAEYIQTAQFYRQQD